MLPDVLYVVNVHIVLVDLVFTTANAISSDYLKHKSSNTECGLTFIRTANEC